MHTPLCSLFAVLSSADLDGAVHRVQKRHEVAAKAGGYPLQIFGGRQSCVAERIRNLIKVVEIQGDEGDG